jgi:hypothetical protein
MQNQLDRVQGQFDRAQAQFDPYTQAGQGALQAQQNLLGLGGAGAQAAAVNQIANNPMFNSLVAQGEDALLQNAAATGGIRGGNTGAALAQFRPQMLNQQIQQQMAHLGGLAGMGMDAASRSANVVSMGANATNPLASQMSGLAGQRGDINASQHLGEYNAQRGFVTDAIGFGLQLAGIPGGGLFGGG